MFVVDLVVLLVLVQCRPMRMFVYNTYTATATAYTMTTIIRIDCPFFVDDRGLAFLYCGCR